MAAQGWHLISVKYPTYEFEQGEPGAYNIRLELFGILASKHEESRQYISFVEDTGAEYIGSVLRWVYFRKKPQTALLFCIPISIPASNT